MVKVTFIAIGLLLMALAIAVGVSVRRFTHVASSADGIVVRLNAGGSHPQIAFVTATGKNVTYPQGGLIFGARVGDHVRVLYRPEDPVSTARMDKFGSLYFVPLLLLAIGLVLLICGLGVGTSNPGTSVNIGRG